MGLLSGLNHAGTAAVGLETTQAATLAHVAAAVRAAAFVPSSLPGYLADYHFDEGAGTTAGDDSGNGHDMTLTSPTWSATGVTFGPGKYGTVPTTVRQNWRTVHVLAGMPASSSQNYLLSSHDAGFQFRPLQTHARDESWPFLYANAMATATNGPLLRPFPCVFSFVADPAGTGYTVYVDGAAPSYVATGGGSTSYADPGATYLGGYGPVLGSVGYQGEVSRLLCYSSAHTAARVRAAADAIRWAAAARGVAFTPRNALTADSLVCYGDSRTNALVLGSVSTSRSYTKYNHGISGLTSTQVLAVARDGGGLAKPTATRSVAVVWAGVNDGATAGTAPSVFANLRAACGALKAAGHTHVAVCTEISALSAAGDAYKNALNALILAAGTGWGSFADLVVRYDLTDLGANGAYAGADFSDGLHPSVAGRAKLYTRLAADIDTLG